MAEGFYLLDCKHLIIIMIDMVRLPHLCQIEKKSPKVLVETCLLIGFVYLDDNATAIVKRLFNSSDVKSQLQGRKHSTITCSLPETAASVAVTATLVGAAVTLLVKRTKPSETKEIQVRACEDCAGSGICSECNGEGFVLKKLSEENAARARKLSKNMATRFTAGLPKKWSYCTKCSSGRSCPTCGGSGKLII